MGFLPKILTSIICNQEKIQILTQALTQWKLCNQIEIVTDFMQETQCAILVLWIQSMNVWQEDCTLHDMIIQTISWLIGIPGVDPSDH